VNRAVFEETLRRHLFNAGYLAYITLIGTVGLIAATFNRPASMWPTLVTMMALVTGCALIGPEFSTGTLQLIVTKPVRRYVYLLSRATGVFASVCVAAMTGFAAESLGRIAFVGLDGVPWQRLGEAMSGALFVSLLSIALLTFLGSITRSYFNAAIYAGTYFFLWVVESALGLARVRGQVVGAYLEQHPGIERAIFRIDEILFAEAPQALNWQWALRVLATAAIALLLACLAFRRREVPYGSE
jgi:ABC-type transport system involved in multi-copper enzyme maturation permease subunit